jgi:ATP-dependent DNA helicase UvrD/PcrA
MQRVPSDNAGSSVAADTYVADLHIHARAAAT